MHSTLNFYGVLCRLFAASSSFGHVNVMIIFSCLRIQQDRSIHGGRSLNWIIKEWRYIERGLSYYRIWCNDGSSVLSVTKHLRPSITKKFLCRVRVPTWVTEGYCLLGCDFVTVYQTAWRHISEDSRGHNHCDEAVQSNLNHIFCVFSDVQLFFWQRSSRKWRLFDD